jgi:hypothetical protein
LAPRSYLYTNLRSPGSRAIEGIAPDPLSYKGITQK